MSQPAITGAQVGHIVARPKFIFREQQNNTQRSPADRRRSDYVQPNELRIYYEIRFTDMREKETGLQVFARLEKPLTAVYPRPKPGISLLLRGRRIRGIGWTFRHETVLNGATIAPVYGWHENLWTDADEDKYLIDINEDVKKTNTDFRSMISFACERWNINIEEKQINIGGLQ
jgi:hypothetical protein